MVTKTYLSGDLISKNLMKPFKNLLGGLAISILAIDYGI